MATVTTASYAGRYLQLDVWESSYSVERNTSTISWKVSSVGGKDNYYTMYSCSANVNGTTVWNAGTVGWSTKKFPAATGEVSGTLSSEVGHDASTGEASIGFSLTGAVFTNSPKTYSGTLGLTKIPRYASITGFNVSARSETEIDFSWSSSDIVDYVWYSLNNGESWHGVDCPDGTSGSFTWGGLSAGTPYNAKLCIRRRDSQLQTFYDGYKTVGTYSYPSISGWPSNITMDSGSKTLTFYFNNPLSRSISYSATFGSYKVSGSTTGGSGSLTFNCDSAYGQIPNATSGTITYAANATGMSGSQTATVYANATYAKPGIDKTKFAYEIVHNKSCLNGLTKMVQGYSYLKIKYTDSSIITLNKSAGSLKSVVFTFDNKSQTVTTTLSAFNSSSTFNIGTTTNGTVTVTDSRGYTNSATISIPFLAYSKPTGTITAARSDGYGTSVTLKGSAVYSTLEGKNAVTLKWKAGSSGTASTFSNGSATTTLASDATQIYYIYVEDSIGNNNNWAQSTSLGQGQPILFIDTKNVGVGINCFPSGKGLYVNGTRVPKITSGTAAPSGGDNGDIYLKY